MKFRKIILINIDFALIIFILSVLRIIVSSSSSILIWTLSLSPTHIIPVTLTQLDLVLPPIVAHVVSVSVPVSIVLTLQRQENREGERRKERSEEKKKEIIKERWKQRKKQRIKEKGHRGTRERESHGR